MHFWEFIDSTYAFCSYDYRRLDFGEGTLKFFQSL